MEEIFHEKQEGQLCGQHCLNALLQGPYYTAVDLATLAQQLDDEERRRMLEAGENSEEYRRFINQPSSNMDDTGFFSVQVIANALNVWGLELVSYGSTSPVAVQARTNPTSQNAFICNYREHWFTIRKIGRQWFNLNSLLTGPELVTDTYLGMFLAQLETEGYTIYIVNGDIPESRADQVLRYVTVTRSRPPRLINEASGSTRAGRAATGGSSAAAAAPTGGSQTQDEDAELQAAMAMSLEGATAQAKQTEDEDLKLAMQLSKSMMEQEEQQMAEIMSTGPIDHTQDVSEEDQIQAAIAMSLSGGSQPKPGGQDMKRASAMPVQDKPKPSTSKAQIPKPPQAQTKTSNTVAASTPPKPSTSTSPVTPPSTSAARPSVPKAPATVPGPSTLPGQGQRLTGSVTSPGAGRQSTPDPDEVRRARLRFLEKKK